MRFDLKAGMKIHYPKLAEVFKTNDDRIVMYVVAMYDQQSPLRESFPDLEKRKDEAIRLSGFDRANTDVINSVKTLTVTSEDGMAPFDELLDAISAYLIFQSNRLWTLIVTNEQSFYEYQRRIMAEIGGDADKDALSAVTLKTKLLEAMDDIHKRLERYYNELTGGDNNLAESISKRKRISPESIATR